MNLLSFTTRFVLAATMVVASVFVAPHTVDAASATVTASPDTTTVGSAVTITWSSEGTNSCTGSGFSTGGQTSGSTTVVPGSTGVKTYSVVCLASGPACTLELQSSSTEDAGVPNSCGDVGTPGGQCSPYGASCETSSPRGGGLYTINQYICTGACADSTITASDTVTVNEPPPPPDPDVSVSVAPTSIAAGGSVLVSWSGTSVTVCSGSGEGFSTGGATSGSVTVTPSNDETFTVTCYDDNSNSVGAGTWQYVYTDYTDWWCPLSGQNFSYYDIPMCPTSNLVQQCDRNGQCSWVNSGDPAGIACSGTAGGEEECKVESANSCVIRTKVYFCNGATQRASVDDSASVNVNNPTVSGSCSASPSSATAGQTVTWSASPTGGDGSYTYSWSGTDGLTGSTQNVQKAYTLPGSKTASVAITSDGETASVNCTNGGGPGGGGGGGGGSGGVGVVTITSAPAAVGGSCTVSPSSQSVDQSVTWNASPTGGNGSYTYVWSGTEGLTGTSQSVQKTYSSIGTKTGSVTITSGGESANVNCLNSASITAPQATLSISAEPVRVQPQTTTNIAWSVTNVEAGSCTLSGTNGDNVTLSGTSGTKTTVPLTGETTYTLRCKNLSDVFVSKSVVVSIVGTVTEE